MPGAVVSSYMDVEIQGQFRPPRNGDESQLSHHNASSATRRVEG